MPCCLEQIEHPLKALLEDVVTAKHKDAITDVLPNYSEVQVGHSPPFLI